MTQQQIQKLVSELSEKQLMTIVSEMVNQNRLCIPQFYNSAHAKFYGFDSIEEMNDGTQNLYEMIDDYLIFNKY